MNKLTAHIRSLFAPFTGRLRNTPSFEEQFHRFREVLERNTRALEIITEMGETLGGDYLFDTQYLKHSCDRLSLAVNDSLAGFAQLTQNRYPKLHDVLSTIDGKVRHAIEDTTPVSESFVLPYQALAGDMAKTVGGKNSNLAEIKNRLGVRVPDAFAVTTRSFETYLEYNRIFEKIPILSGPSVPAALLQKARELILNGVMPPDISRDIDKAVKEIKSRSGEDCKLAVRSSAAEEDADFSFAGQFETVLNVPLETPAVERAYRQVIASLFSEKAVLYQTQLGYGLQDMKMAVACVVMVDAVVSGVLYTCDPQGDRNAMIINATWGLGTAVVEGQADADYFRIRKQAPGAILETRIGAKESLIRPLEQGGTGRSATPEEKKCRASLSPGQIAELVPLAVLIERHFRRPQDIEWAIDRRGRLFILQSRPLRVPESETISVSASTAPDAPVIVKHLGLVVQKGIAAGQVFIAKNERDLDAVPRGAILVARHDSSSFVRVMTEVSAIITEIGTPTSHMAALCREFRIPTVVNAGNATQVLKQGQEITVRVESEGATLYQGMIRELVEQGAADSARMEALIEYRRKRYLLRYIVPLNLVDPLRDSFTPQACRTMHDILRFIHEKSVAELIENAGKVKKGLVKLDLPVPARIMMIDIGGGLRNPAGLNHIGPERIASLPLRAIVRGMTQPGVWRSDSMPLGMKDFMSGMLRAPDVMSPGRRVEQSMAIISREYANINLKFGYHFIVLDCYCSERTRNNHIYFRFAGGAADMSKRSRRLQLIASILGEYGFNSMAKGDYIVARLANIPQQDAEMLLDQIGRLFSYTRQLDAVLSDDSTVERLAKSFHAGNYELVEAGGQ